MRNYFSLTAVFMVACLSQTAAAVERIEEPLTFRQGVDWKANTYLELDPVDMQKISAEDLRNEQAGGLKRIAVARKEKAGEIYELDGEWSSVDDMSVWRMKVNAADARWLSFTFTDLFLPRGASLYVYNESKDQVLGPYTDADNKPSKSLWTPMIDGQSAYIEINVPTALKPYLSFDLKSVNHGYRSFKESFSKASGLCNIDVVCPQGDGWRDEIRSVAHYLFERVDGFFVCTGNMVNNLGGDRKAYFLTASHCAAEPAEVNSMVLYWNFETSACGASPNGSRAQSQSGATLLATLDGLSGPEPRRDMTLVRLDSLPDPDFNVYWSGWDSTFATPQSGVSIHHPGGFEKRISVESDPAVFASFSTNQPDPDGAHLRVIWDQGTTESGSSGAGFWNQQKRLVGVLSGGGASCDTPNDPDFYSSLAVNYDIGTSPSENLKSWLDPENTGLSGVDGLDGCDAPNAEFTYSPGNLVDGQAIVFTPNAAAGGGATYEWDFDGDGLTDSSVMSPSFAYGAPYIGNVTLTVTNSSSCSGSSSSAIVVSPASNLPPDVSAVANPASANEESDIQLDSSATTNDDGFSLTYVWRQMDGPAAIIADDSSSVTSVRLPTVLADTVISFEVEVTDSFGESASESVSVTVLNVTNVAPTASVDSAALTVNEGASVSIGAGTSSDPDGDTLSYSWAQTGGPSVTLVNSTSATATFSAPLVSSATALTFVVTVSDPAGLTDTATMTVSVLDVPPVDSGGGGGGGGGALGLPLLLLLAIAGWVRAAGRASSRMLLLAGCSVTLACATVDSGKTVAAEDRSVSPGSGVGESALFVKRLSEATFENITPHAELNKVVAAFENRERRYEKIKPVFEHEMKIDVNGKSETWMISPSGYIQQENSYQLYKMDVSALKDFMK